MSNEVFFMAFPGMLVLYTLSKAKDLEKELENEKQWQATKRDGSGCSQQKPWGKIICLHSIRMGAASQK